MLAIIETGGKQYQVSPNETLDIEKIDKEVGTEVIFDKVLLIADGENIQIGAPYLKDAKVTAKVEKLGKGDKIRVFKYKSKSRYRRAIGHRQQFTSVKIEQITA